MKKYHSLLMVGLCIVSMACTIFGRTIVVSGMVIDSISGDPVSKAHVLFIGLSSLSADLSDLSKVKVDSTYSNTDGTFKDTISTDASILLYGATKDGYELTWNNKMLLFSSQVNIGTIKLYPTGTAPKDTFMVSGTVVDSVTGKPIDGALVIMSGMSLSITGGDTVLTASNGTFSKQAIVSRTGPFAVLIYAVSKPGYVTHIGQNQPSGKQVNLGSIELAPGGTGVVLPQRVTALYQRSANTMGVFTLSGKRLYAGPARQLDKTLPHGTGIAVVRFARGNSTAAAKIMSVK